MTYFLTPDDPCLYDLDIIDTNINVTMSLYLKRVKLLLNPSLRQDEACIGYMIKYTILLLPSKNMITSFTMLLSNFEPFLNPETSEIQTIFVVPFVLAPPYNTCGLFKVQKHT